MSATDPFPRERVSATIRRMPAYLKLAWRLAKDPLLSRARRAAVIGAAGYLASPIDLVPGVIPVIGQLDDLAVALAALRIALAGLSPERRREHLDAVGLADQDLADDLRTVGATTAWIGRAGFRATKSTASAGVRAANAAARSTRSAADRATPTAKAAAARVTPMAQAVGDAAAPVARAIGGVAGPVTRAATPAVQAVVDRTAPAAKSMAKGAARAGGRAMGAAGAAARRLPRPGRDPKITVSPVDVPLLPPPPPGRPVS